jgi:hypothetical protein
MMRCMYIPNVQFFQKYRPRFGINLILRDNNCLPFVPHVWEMLNFLVLAHRQGCQLRGFFAKFGDFLGLLGIRGFLFVKVNYY